ncbi:cadherin domain-containing protein, partial [bacterium]|nr:cadherin domain-containing protein [bacterium]
MGFSFSYASNIESSLFIKSDGSLWTMGKNDYGQLGDGTTVNRTNPVKIISSGVIACARGYRFNIFLKQDGSLWGMGHNSYGQLGDGTTTHRHNPIQIIGDGVKYISAGGDFVHFIKSDDSLWGLGRNELGQLGDGTYSQRHSPVMIVSSGVKSVDAGTHHMHFIKTDGSLWSTGYNEHGMLGDGSPLNTGAKRNDPIKIVNSGVLSVSAGIWHSIFVKSNGSLWTMGFGGGGRLGTGSDQDRNTPVQILSSGVLKGVAGVDFTVIYKTDGTVYSVGTGGNGQLGTGNSANQYSLTFISNVGSTVGLSAGSHQLLLRSNGSLHVTGLNSSGQLGDGTTTNRYGFHQILASGVVRLNDMPVPLNNTPIIGSNGGGETATKNVLENQTAVTTVSATDPDAGTTITYSISGGADGGKFNINGSTGVISFATPPNYESPTDSGANNSFVVNVRASDGQLYDEQTITVTVTSVNESPSISSNGGGNTASKSVLENQTGVTTVSATDPDAGTTIFYSISGGVDASKFQINGSSGELSFKTVPNYESPTDSGANNSYVVKVRASDGALHDEQTITVNVTNINESPSITSNGAGNTASKNVSENQTGVTTVSATDPDAGTTITYSITGGVDASKFQINGNSGALSFKNAPDFETPTDSGANNGYVVKVRATDGAMYDEQTITVNVTNVNESPSIASNGGGASASKSVSENQTGVTTVSATDPDAGTTIIYSITGGVDASKFQINGNTGVLSFKNAPDFETPTDSGANNGYVVKVRA